MPSFSSAIMRRNSVWAGSGASSTATESAPTKLCPARIADAITVRLSPSWSVNSSFAPSSITPTCTRSAPSWTSAWPGLSCAASAFSLPPTAAGMSIRAISRSSLNVAHRLLCASDRSTSSRTFPVRGRPLLCSSASGGGETKPAMRRRTVSARGRSRKIATTHSPTSRADVAAIKIIASVEPQKPVGCAVEGSSPPGTGGA